MALRVAAGEAGAAGVVLAGGVEEVDMVLVLVSLGSRIILRGIGCVSRSVCIGLSVCVSVCVIVIAWVTVAACLGVSITGAVPKIAFGFGLCGVVGVLSVLLGGPRIAVGFCLTVVVIGVVGTGTSLGLVCRGGGSLVRILYRKLVPFNHWASISVSSGPVYPGSLGSL